MPAQPHLKDITGFDTRPLAEICNLLREHVAICPECRTVLAEINRHEAAVWMYGEVKDPVVRQTAMETILRYQPDNPLYIELVAEPLISFYLRRKFPTKIWRT